MYSLYTFNYFPVLKSESTSMNHQMCCRPDYIITCKIRKYHTTTVQYKHYKNEKVHMNCNEYDWKKVIYLELVGIAIHFPRIDTLNFQ